MHRRRLPVRYSSSGYVQEAIRERLDVGRRGETKVGSNALPLSLCFDVARVADPLEPRVHHPPNRGRKDIGKCFFLCS